MGYQFGVGVEFRPEGAAEILAAVPDGPGVFALWGDGGEPYLTRAADMRRRMKRLLDPPAEQSKRLNLRERVRRIEYSRTGSEFESLLVLYDAAAAVFGAVAARRRLKLYPPYFVRLTLDREHPRVYVTNRLSAGGLGQMYGPFASRVAAERYSDAVLDLFRLRRCYEELVVHPEHPGCAYGEMRKCMAPCNVGCTGEEYRAEAAGVEAFFRTRGESLLAGIAAERERASGEMEFEAAAAAHERYSKVKAAAMLADELVRPVGELRAMVVTPAAGGEEAQEACVFLLDGGELRGPARMSTLGVRAVKEQTSVGSSLFAQPLMLQAVTLDGAVTEADSPELRAERVIAGLEDPTHRKGAMNGAQWLEDPTHRKGAMNGAQDLTHREGRVDGVPGSAGGRDLAVVGDHLSLFRRWYYRPEKQRVGECFLPNADGSWPVRRILRGAARMALGIPKAMAETDRDGVAAAKMKLLHEGREGVERAVPVAAKRGRRAKAVVPGDVVAG